MLKQATALINNCPLLDGIEGTVYLGVPISVCNVESYYYVPIFYGKDCLGIVTLYKNKEEYAYKYSVGFAAIINELEAGTYYYVKKRKYYIFNGRKCTIYS